MHTSHGTARETAVKDGLHQLVSMKGSSLGHLDQHIRTNNFVMLFCLSRKGLIVLLALISWLRWLKLKHSMLTSSWQCAGHRSKQQASRSC